GQCRRRYKLTAGHCACDTSVVRRGNTCGVSTSRVASMRDAIADLVRDGDTVAIEGFTHLIGFAAGHEIIRQGRRDLTLARLTPDVLYGQMIAAGAVVERLLSV